MPNIIPFTITATNLNLADTTEQTIVNFPSDNRIRVPIRLELLKEAGTAYTISEAGGFRVDSVDGNTTDSYTDLFRGGAFVTVISTARENESSQSQGVAFFYVPMVGFLDQTGIERRLALASVRPRVFRTGATKMKLRLTANVASGTGSLHGRLYYDEYSLGGW